ncbi:MucR family transcriptional regulator [Sinorhizobium saheli]|uniref:MucR family transcriptional regulator n=1 Tax=Sinorhizobium saheli TaxID=36856 RepID=A0A178YS16_SINSA|nr:MucR family transcriptional regulator [Sinorhizobium saheli]MQW90691.1 MucR family transcriptional regulator [Sinorhizobium saheli]OAP50071.1 MucR family transcriptional regulator [Sinorhizobium saheli]
MTEPRSDADERTLELTGRIVAAYLSRNAVAIDELPSLIQQTHTALNETSSSFQANEAPVIEEQRPAVPVKKSVTEEFIICLEDGKRLKLLRRHLMAKFGLTPEQYREKWKLPADYPMTAPAYARQRAEIALGSGLGKRPAPSTPAAAEAALPQPRKKIGPKFR